jgi:hypothetical protein
VLRNGSPHCSKQYWFLKPPERRYRSSLNIVRTNVSLIIIQKLLGDCFHSCEKALLRFPVLWSSIDPLSQHCHIATSASAPIQLLPCLPSLLTSKKIDRGLARCWQSLMRAKCIHHRSTSIRSRLKFSSIIPKWP